LKNFQKFKVNFENEGKILLFQSKFLEITNIENRLEILQFFKDIL